MYNRRFEKLNMQSGGFYFPAILDSAKMVLKHLKSTTWGFQESSVHRPHWVGSVLTTLVNILPYRPPTRLIRAKQWTKLQYFKRKRVRTWFPCAIASGRPSSPVDSSLLSCSSTSGMYGVHISLWCSVSVLAGRLMWSFTEYLRIG